MAHLKLDFIAFAYAITRIVVSNDHAKRVKFALNILHDRSTFVYATTTTTTTAITSSSTTLPVFEQFTFKAFSTTHIVKFSGLVSIIIKYPLDVLSAVRFICTGLH